MGGERSSRPGLGRPARRRRAPSLALAAAAVAAAAALAAGCAARMGSKTTEGAIEALRASAPPEGQLSERVGRHTTRGALDELSSPERLEELSTIVDAAVTRSLEAALRVPVAEVPAPGGGRPVVQAGRGGPPRSLAGRVAGDSGSALSAAVSAEIRRELGPEGRGPLAASLGATAAEISGSAVRGARAEMGGLFPGCENEDRACIEEGVRSLGRAAATGFVEGMLGSAAVPALALAFVIGVLVAVVARGTLALMRRVRHPEERRAHS